MIGLTDSDYELIEAKIDGSLDDREQNLFEQKLKDSKEFEDEFKMQQAVIGSLVSSNNEALRSEFHGFLLESKEQKRPTRINKSLMMAASLSFLVLYGIAYYLFLPAPTDTAALYQAYFEVYPAPPITRREDQGLNSAVFESYREGNYEQALDLLKVQPKSEMTSLYLAMCFLETGDMGKGTSYLKSLTQSDNPTISQTAEWYLALAYLKNELIEDGTQLLQKISNEQQLYNREANEILGQIKE